MTGARLPGEGGPHAHILDQQRGAQIDSEREEGGPRASWWGDTTPNCGSCEATAASCRAGRSRRQTACCSDCQSDWPGPAGHLHSTPRGSVCRAALYARHGVPDPLVPVSPREASNRPDSEV